LRRISLWFLLACVCAGAAAQSAAPAEKPADEVLGILRAELHRSFAALKKEKMPPYFISYQLTDNRAISASSSFGALTDSDDQTTRVLDLDLRVGDYRLDNTHRVTRDFATTQFGMMAGTVPLEDDDRALAVALWLETDRHYKHALQRFEAVKAETRMSVEDEDPSPDFSEAPAEKQIEPLAALEFDRAAWEEKVRAYGKPFRSVKGIQSAGVNASGELETRRYVNTDGSEIRISMPLYRLDISASVKADDGEILPLHRQWMSFTAQGLPSDAEVQAAVTEMVKLLDALRTAPVGEAYTGPAILSGRASAVFFHETFGHRIEGDRMKADDDAQTFKNKVNQRVLPPFLSVFSDPTLRRSGNADLVGSYSYDDEGVKSRRVTLVENGVLKSFLTSRSPISGFPSSNGHGRRQQGHFVEARQANLLVESARTVSRAEMKKQLLARIRSMKKPYGLLVDDISGGFTFTTRYMPNAFSVVPTVVYRVYPDGREELVRGLDLIGTPLIAFSKISAADNEPGIFNGICGADSGWVPVSAVAPGLLVDQIEIQRKEKSQDRGPILPPPDEDKEPVAEVQR
jgi:predicted Zn-dependent protease